MAPQRVCNSTPSCTNCTAIGMKLQCPGYCTCMGVTPAEQPEFTKPGMFYLVDPCSELTIPSRGDMSALVTGCLTTPSDYTGTTVYLLGDSHAANYVPAFSAALAQYGANATLKHAVVGHLCGYNSKEFIGAIMGGWAAPLIPRCHAYIDTVTSILEQSLRAGDVVAIATAMYKYWSYPVLDSLKFDLTFLQSLRSFVESRGASLILLDDGPKLPQNGYTCVSTGNVGNCLVDREVAMQQRHAATLALESFADQTDSTSFFNSFEIFCPRNISNKIK